MLAFRRSLQRSWSIDKGIGYATSATEVWRMTLTELIRGGDKRFAADPKSAIAPDRLKPWSWGEV